MTIPDLVVPAALAGRRGGPFPADEVESACAAIRAECGWHIAPRVAAHRVVVSGTGWVRLILPSSHGPACPDPEVHGVRDVVADRPLLGWRRGNVGTLIRAGGWPRGEDNLEVTLTHGYDECPADLLAVVAERTRVLVAARVPGTQSTTRTVGEVTRTASITDSAAARTPAWTAAAEAVLAKYRVS